MGSVWGFFIPIFCFSQGTAADAGSAKGDYVMTKRNVLTIVRELARGRLQIVTETKGAGIRLVVNAERTAAILAVILIVVVIAHLM